MRKLCSRLLRRLPPDQRRNLGVVLVLLAAGGILEARFDPNPIGADADLLYRLRPRSAPPSFTRTAVEGGAGSPAVAPLIGRPAVDKYLEVLKRGRERLLATPDYTANFSKQERIGSELGPEQQLLLKLRHAPFSVYMKWLTGDKGREVLFVDGDNDGKMIVHPGGVSGRLLRSVKIDPEGERAMRESRHPITQAGLLNLVNKMIKHREEEIASNEAITSRFEFQHQCNGRSAWLFAIEFPPSDDPHDYRKSIQLIDQEWCVPVAVRNYGWPEDKSSVVAGSVSDDETLLENYQYHEIHFGQQLADRDFDKLNEAYQFRR